LEEKASSVSAYFPPGNWYSYYDGSKQTNGQVTLDAPFGFINLHVRGGNILPTQDPALNTALSRQNPFGLIVALNADNSAQGGLYYDDGESIEPQDTGNYFHSRFTYSGGELRQTVEVNGYSEMSQKVLGSIRLLGAGTITRVTVNGSPHTDFTSLPSGEVKVNNLTVPMASAFVITFS
jgi:alpha-glucosidase (family GH31 glycosyl hydrolase)